jgi:hypothetical protein
MAAQVVESCSGASPHLAGSCFGTKLDRPATLREQQDVGGAVGEHLRQPDRDPKLAVAAAADQRRALAKSCTPEVGRQQACRFAIGQLKRAIAAPNDGSIAKSHDENVVS